MLEIDDKFKEGMLKPDEKLEAFDKHGITEDYLLDKLKEELEAHAEIHQKIGKKEVKIIKVPIWKIQQDARKDAHKLRGDYPAERHEHTGDVIFHSNVPEPDMPEEEKKEEDNLPDPNRFRKESKEEEKPPLTPDVEFYDAGSYTEAEIPKKEIEPPEWVKKEEPTPEHDQDKEFKDHHRSRRESGK